MNSLLFLPPESFTFSALVCEFEHTCCNCVVLVTTAIQIKSPKCDKNRAYPIPAWLVRRQNSGSTEDLQTCARTFLQLFQTKTGERITTRLSVSVGLFFAENTGTSPEIPCEVQHIDILSRCVFTVTLNQCLLNQWEFNGAKSKKQTWRWKTKIWNWRKK